MKRALLLLMLVLLLAAAAAGLWVVQRVSAPYAAFSGEQFVDIPPGESTSAIGRRLVSAGVIRDELTFRLAWQWAGQGRSLKAGEYRFTEPATPAAVLDQLARGDVFLLPVTFPEGLTLHEMGDVFERAGFGQAKAFVTAAQDPASIRALDPAADTLEGYLFPDTYHLPRHTSAEALVQRMTRRFIEIFDESMQQRAKASGLTTRQIVTLAALVEKETARGDERPVVAAVYHNRLRIGMPMQCDPTVIYALKRAGQWDGNLTRADLRFDSPYNTYRYPGLPPGPIASPGEAALEATLAPATVDYLYFVSRNDGSHVFATNLPDHNRNVQEWQVEHFRRERGEMRNEEMKK